MIKRWVIYIFVLLSAYIFFLMYRMWVSWYLLMLIILLPFISLLVGFIRFKKFKPDIAFSKTVKRNWISEIEVFQAGSRKKDEDEDNVNFLCNYNCIFTIEDCMSGIIQKKKINSNGQRDFKIPVDTSHCGRFIYVFKSIRYYDFLGLFFFTRKINKDFEITVMPIKTSPVAMPRLDAYKTKSYKKSNSPYSEIYDIREYKEGDSLKNIHWKMTAKRDEMMVREPLDEDLQNARLVLVLLEDRDLMDKKLDEFVFISEYFLNHGVSHRVEVITSRNDDRAHNMSYDVFEDSDISKMIYGVLGMRLPEKVNHE